MATPEEIIERLTDLFVKASKTSAMPVAFVGEGVTVNNPDAHVIVGLEREPTAEEAAGVPSEIEGEKIEYLIFRRGQEPAIWTPPAAAP